MDIESKQWRIRTTGIAGQAELEHKPSGRTYWPQAGDVPSAGLLAAVSERRFDELMKGLAR